MNVLLIVIFAISFFAYCHSALSFIVYIFNKNKLSSKAILVMVIINLVYWVTYILFIPIEYESYAIILCAGILFIETKMLFITSIYKNLFIMVTFTMSLFAQRLLILSGMALFAGDNIVNAVHTPEQKAIAAIITFISSVIAVRFCKHILPRKSIDTIFADNKNITFLNIMFSIILGVLFNTNLTISSNSPSNNLIYLYVIIGITVLGCATVFMLFAYYLAELRISTETFKKLKKRNEEDLKNLRSLEKEAIHEPLTSLFTREYGGTILQNLIEENVSVFVAFIDLDELKIVNDVFGHDEGDFYIETVARIVRDYFDTDIVCRYGGDEILVLGKNPHEENIARSMVQCCNAVSEISKQNKKEYETSISYGVAIKHQNETLTASELIDIADSRMYEHKKSRKKQRS